MRAEEIAALLPHMTPDERRLVDELVRRDAAPWRPLPGPQSMAYHSAADVVGYGGAAGGGKTDLACGQRALPLVGALSVGRDSQERWSGPRLEVADVWAVA